MEACRRLGQGAFAAAASMWLALSFHLLAGGNLPTLAGLVISFVLSWCACLALAAWRTDVLRLSASVVSSQALFHGLFVFGSAAWLSDSGHAHAHAGPGGLDSSTVHLGMASQMWWAHLGAAVVTILALRSSERAFSRLARLAADLVRRLVLPCIDVAVLPESDVLPPPAIGLRVSQDLGRYSRAIPPRGPPVSARLR